MATTWNSFGADHSLDHNHLRGVVGLGFSAALPTAGYLLVNAIADASGLVPGAATPMGVPAWTVAAATMITLPLWGVARWLVAQHGDAGRVASRWIIALMAGAILLPFALTPANTFLASLLPMLVLLTGIVAAMRASALSATAGLLMLPGLVGLGVGSLIGFTALAGGWSPPFALVDHNKH